MKIKELNLPVLQSLLPPREVAAHKGNFGHVLVIGGNYGMAGAVRMAGEAAARVGAGLVSIATRPQHLCVISSVRPELMCHGIESSADLAKLFLSATVIIIGPGLGQCDWSQDLFHLALQAKQPKIVDADALNLLSKHPQKNTDWILTPHVGEAARLLNCSTADIQNNRVASVQKLAETYHGTIVLKGAGTLVMSNHHNAAICNAGNPGMASGGMGDVLSGVIAGLVAQGLTLSQAADLGVCVHAAAGDLAKVEGERGMLALDLMPFLRKLVNNHS